MTDSSRYAKAGVDIDAGDRVKKRIAELSRNTFTPNVMHKDGAFGAMFSLASLDIKKPVLVSSVDGVGTKVKVAIAYGQHKGIGKDLVNHCIDDLLPCGAKPLFFLDYFACGKQDDEVVLQLIEGMSEACTASGTALIGGETAPMPDVYAADEYDLAGTIVGVVDEDTMIDNSTIAPGQTIVGLPSSGLHTNGYTLARTVLLNEAGMNLNDTPPGFELTLGEELLAPHRSYLHEINTIREKVNIHGISHITGGGFEGNLSRIMPETCQAVIDTRHWAPPRIFKLIQHQGEVSNTEMYRVFNMGVGMCVIVDEKDANTVTKLVSDAFVVGHIETGGGVQVIF